MRTYRKGTQRWIPGVGGWDKLKDLGPVLVGTIFALGVGRGDISNFAVTVP